MVEPKMKISGWGFKNQTKNVAFYFYFLKCNFNASKISLNAEKKLFTYFYPFLIFKNVEKRGGRGHWNENYTGAQSFIIIGFKTSSDQTF